jgi:hypothetical protein
MASDDNLHSYAVSATVSGREVDVTSTSIRGTYPRGIIWDLPVKRLDIAVECQDHGDDQDQDKDDDYGQYSSDGIL